MTSPQMVEVQAMCSVWLSPSRVCASLSLVRSEGRPNHEVAEPLRKCECAWALNHCLEKAEQATTTRAKVCFKSRAWHSR